MGTDRLTLKHHRDIQLLASTAVNANTIMTTTPKLFSLPRVHAVILTTTPLLSLCAWLRHFMSVPVVAFPPELAVNSREIPAHMIRQPNSPCVLGTNIHFDPLTVGGATPISVWLAVDVPAAFVHVGKSTLSGSIFCTLLYPTEMTCPKRHFSVPSNLSTSHTTYSLAPMRALSGGELSKYVLSLDPCNSVGIGLPAWSDRISVVGAACVTASPVMAKTDASNRIPLMMRVE